MPAMNAVSVRARLARALLASTALVGVGTSLAQAQSVLPTGGQVVSGGVAIGTPAGGALTITQSSATAIVNWQGFSIGQANRVDIRQPDAASAILNRVTGATPSTIAGQLDANGQVYLVNPNGITITKTGRVNAGGGFVASTLDIADEDFRAGRRQFRGAGASAKVTNQGAITIGRGGYAALIGGQVSNSGTISVPMGRVGLGSGERATLDLSGDGFLQVEIPTQAKGRGALVRSSGVISADGGSVTLTAAAARDAARQAVNLSGTIEARAVSGRNGRITLSGGDGTVAVTGRIDASARQGTGGTVTVTGRDIRLGRASIDASGAAGGGSVQIGGGRQGRGTLAHARTLTVDAATTVRADATRSGNGGDVVLWSDLHTAFAGTISARGGARGGDGGQAEVSSRGMLAYTGFADLTAAKGSLGSLLLDPYNITISGGTDTTSTGFTARGNDSVINGATLLAALGGANVTVSTGTGGAQAGNITLAASTPLAWNTGATLTLQAAGAVTLNSSVTAQAGGLTIAAGAGTSTATADLSVARFTLASGDWVQNAATLPGFAAGDFQVTTGASFLRAAGGNGSTATPFLLTDSYGVQGMGTASSGVNYLGARYRLANDVDASGTAAWNGGLGFSPVGTSSASFTGSLDGAGHTITGLTIARPSQDDVGLIGRLSSGGSVSGLGMIGGSVSGASGVGGLVGYNASGQISRVYSTGAVSGSDSVGGLVGSNAYGGHISQSYATGSVAASTGNVGGLAGTNSYGSEINQSYASGNVSGMASNSAAGGLVGSNFYGNVNEAYASGNVSGSGSSVGGLIGSNNSNTLTNTYWDKQTTGQTNGVGSGLASGATDLTTAQARSAANYAGFDFSNVWYQAGDMRPILRSEAATAVGGVTAVSNLHQLQLMGANLTGSYRLTADLDASATASSDSSSGIWGAGGFVPVGTNSSSNAFTGSLDGAGHTITGLTIARPSQSYVGLFAYLGMGGTVSGLGLVGGSVVGAGFVGGLVGYNANGTVSRSYTSGSASGTTRVGGLVGYNFGGTVSQSYASGSVSGTANAVGGLVGYNLNGRVYQSYASGSVSGGPSALYVGGLVGYNGSSTVSQSYASGSVTGYASVGGLVGYNVRSTTSSTVSESYASGSVSGNSSVGGLVGSNTSSTLTNNYWDTQTSGTANGVSGGNASGATGLSTAQARTASAYTGWDFTAAWYQAGDMRPMLRSEAAAAVGGVTAVSNLHQLQLMGANLAGSYRLTANIDASATASSDSSAGIWGAGGFVPVGNNSVRYTGSLDGAGHTIAGLTIARPSQDYVGLIGSLDIGGTVTGLGLVGGSVSGHYYVGSLGGANAGTVSRSYATTGVSGTSIVGGLVGGNSGLLTQSYATGAVSGGANAISLGGLAGDNFGTIRQAYASGNVSGGSNSTSIGGLVGSNVNGSVTQAYATGAVSGSNSIGGLAGYTSIGGISQAYATGAVSGSTTSVGGLVGENDNSTISASYWNTQTAGPSGAVGLGASAGIAGLKTAQMQDLAAFQTNYAGFDFASVWAPPNQVGQGGQTTAYTPQLYGLSRVVAVTAASASRVYGDANPALGASYAGLQPGDFVTGLGSLSTSATAASHVGSYASTASGSAVTAAGGSAYRIVYVPATLSVTPRPLTVNGAGIGIADKTYDGTTTATITGFSGSPSVTALGGDVVTLDASGVTGAFTDKSAGTGKTVIVTGFTLGGTDAGNYSLVQPTGLTASISKRDLALSGVNANSKTYDGTTNATLSGSAVVSAIGSDVVSVSGSGAGSTFADKNAGTGKAVTVSGYALSGADAGNYNLVAPTGLTADIAKANLPVLGVNAANKTYDGTTAASITGTAAVAAFGSDSVSVSGTAFASFANKNAGVNKAVTVTGFTLTGADAGNYNVIQPSGLTGSIFKANLSVSGLTANSRTYDGTIAVTLTGAASVTAFGSDVVSVSGAGSATFANKNAGANKAVTVTGYTLGGADSSNYNIVQPSGLFATIFKADLVVSGVSATNKTYDGTTNATLSGAASVTALGSDVVSVSGSGAGSTFADKNAGTGKAVTVAGYTLVGTDAGNYNIVQPVGLTADIAKATLSVAGVSAASKTYDGTTNAALSGTASVTAFGSDVVSVSGAGSAAFADKNAGAAKAVTVTGYTLSGTDAGNYDIVQPTGLISTINKANLTISGLSADSKIYDGTTAAMLGGTASVAAFGSDVVSVSGAGFATFADKNAGANKAVIVTGYTLTGTDAGNYTVVQPSGLIGTIFKADLVVSGVSAANKTYDGTTAATLGGTASVTALGSDVVAVSGAGAASFADKNAGTGKAVTVSGYTLTGLDAGNYTLVQPSGLTADIAKASLSVTGVNVLNKSYDGTTTATVSGAASVTAFGSDVVTVSGGAGSASFADKNAGAAKAVTVTGYTLSGLDAGNYDVIQPSGLTGTIFKADIAVVGVSAANKTYDGTTAATLSGTASVTAFGSDVVSVSGAGSAAFADKNAGAGKAVTVTGYTLVGADAGNYTVVQPSGLTADIARASLSVTGVNALSKTYDGTAAATLSGTASVTTLGNDVVALSGAGAASFADKNAGAGKAVTVTGYTLVGTDAGNYTLVQPSGLTADIGRATLSVTGVNVLNKTYDGTTAATLGGTAGVTALGSDAVAVSGAGSASFADKNAGAAKAVIVTGYTLAGLDAGNYTLVQPSGLTADIAPATLAYAATGTSRTYGGANPALGGTVTGFVHGETQAGVTSGALSFTTAATTGSDVGAYAITGSGLTANHGNYVFVQAAGNAGALRITPAPITVTADSGSSVYGEAPVNPGLSATGLQGGQDIGVLTGLSNSFGLTATSNAGRYALSVAGSLTNGNYAITARDGGSFTIAPRPITVTAAGQGKVYGAADPSLGYTVGGSGLVGADTLSGSLGRAAGENVGTYSITQGSLAAGANYSLTYQGASLSIAPRAITVTADAQSRVYGEADPALTYRVGGLGLVSGDQLTGGLVTATDTRSNVGRYAIGQGSLTASSNYAVTYQGAELTVTARPITVIADAMSRTYGDANPAMTVTIGGRGLVNGDTLSGSLATAAIAGSDVGRYGITQGSLAASPNYSLTYQGASLTIAPRPITVAATGQGKIYGEADPSLGYTVAGSGLVNGDTLSGSLGRAAGETVGRYGITQGSLAASPNYTLRYQGADLSIAPRAVTVTADPQTRVYGDANPGLTYTVGGRGLVNGDTLSGGLATVAGATSHAGSYGIDQGSLAASANYVLTYAGSTLTVSPRPITVAADAQTRVYGDANPGLTYAVGGRGLANDDALLGSLATTADGRSGVGSYAIGQGSLSASADYALTYQGAALRVTPRPLTIVLDSQSRTAGTTARALTYTVGGRGLVNGDTLTGAPSTTATDVSQDGTYPIGQGSLAASANYSLTVLGADLTVTPAPVTAASLASTLERIIRLDTMSGAHGEPQFAVQPGADGRLTLGDPQFDRALVCLTNGSCFLVAPGAAAKPPAGATARPQASAATAPR